MSEPFQRLRIGITGTNGKTGTILLLAFILGQLGYRPAVLDSWRGIRALEKAGRTADDAQSHILLAEVPVEALRQHRLTGDMFDCGILTNLSVDHLTACGTPERYHDLKYSFFQSLPSRGTAVLPADDPIALSLAGEIRHNFISYALSYSRAMITAENIRPNGHRQDFQLCVTSELPLAYGKTLLPCSAGVRLPMAGLHNVANALAAASLALWLTGDLSGIAGAISRFPGIRRNLEIIATDTIRIVDDGACNPAATRSALLATEAIYGPRIHVLHGIYGGGGQTVNRLNARELACFMHKHPESHLFVTRSMYHSKSRDRVRLEEEKAFLDELKKEQVDFYYYPDLPDACESILSHAGQGGLILMVGGATLNRARDMMLQATGEKRASHALIPSGLIAAGHYPCGQAAIINPS
jgi:UDP-N-acetylmuramyl tripeptide synthase